MAVLKLTLICFLALAIIFFQDVHGLICYHCGGGESVNCTDGENGISKDCGILKATCTKYADENGTLVFRTCDYASNAVGCEKFDNETNDEVCYCDTNYCNGGIMNATSDGGLMCYHCGTGETGDCIDGQNGKSMSCGPLNATCSKKADENGRIKFRSCDYTPNTIGCQNSETNKEVCYCNTDNCNDGIMNGTNDAGDTNSTNGSIDGSETDVTNGTVDDGGFVITKRKKKTKFRTSDYGSGFNGTIDGGHTNITNDTYAGGLMCYHCGFGEHADCIDGENGDTKECGAWHATCSKDIYANGTVYGRGCYYMPSPIGCHFWSDIGEVCYCDTDNCNGGGRSGNSSKDLMCYQCGLGIGANVSCADGQNGTSKQCGPINATCWRSTDENGTVVARDCNYIENPIGCHNLWDTTAEDCYCDTHHCNGGGGTNHTIDGGAIDVNNDTIDGNGTDVTIVTIDADGTDTTNNTNYEANSNSTNDTNIGGLMCYHCGFGEHADCIDGENGNIRECGSWNATCFKEIYLNGTVYGRGCNYIPSPIGCHFWSNTAEVCFCDTDNCNAGGRTGNSSKDLMCYQCGLGFGANVSCIDGLNGTSKQCGPMNATCWKLTHEDGTVIARNCNYMKTPIGCSNRWDAAVEDCYCDTHHCNGGGGSNHTINGDETDVSNNKIDGNATDVINGTVDGGGTNSSTEGGGTNQTIGNRDTIDVRGPIGLGGRNGTISFGGTISVNGTLGFDGTISFGLTNVTISLGGHYWQCPVTILSDDSPRFCELA